MLEALDRRFHKSIDLQQSYCLYGRPERRELTCLLQIVENSLLLDMQGTLQVSWRQLNSAA
jgi:hypothetical protein